MTFYVQTYPYRRMARRWAHLPWQAVPGETRERTLGINIREEDDAYILSALVPGIQSDGLNIQILEDVVRIEGEYKAEDSTYLVRELPQGSFTRTLRLPAPIDAEHVEAEVTNGVLTLRLPKTESARPKQIKIKPR
ncbi:MAG TPA: Hsp20/alpha crystallin family protein [Anaerolineales bacterium]|nr:Hsp20/alpha crystallin family protein [Anaerolineales bacterium]